MSKCLCTSVFTEQNYVMIWHIASQSCIWSRWPEYQVKTILNQNNLSLDMRVTEGLACAVKACSNSRYTVGLMNWCWPHRSVPGTALGCSSGSGRRAGGAHTGCGSPSRRCRTPSSPVCPRSSGGTCTWPTCRLTTGHRCCHSCTSLQSRGLWALREGTE